MECKCISCKNKNVMCEVCTANSDMYNHNPCYEPKLKTNFDKITESVESLAKLIIDTVTKCQFNECEDCPLYEVDGCSRQEKVIEWLQKECDNE